MEVIGSNPIAPTTYETFGIVQLPFRLPICWIDGADSYFGHRQEGWCGAVMAEDAGKQGAAFTAKPGYREALIVIAAVSDRPGDIRGGKASLCHPRLIQM